MATDDGLFEQGKAVINQALGGNLTPDTACTLVNMLSNQSKLIELDAMLQRLDTIEKTVSAMAKNEDR